MEHGYVFSMAVSTIFKWLKLVPFYVKGRTVDSAVFQNKYLDLKINIMAWVPRKINK